MYIDHWALSGAGRTCTRTDCSWTGGKAISQQGDLLVLLVKV